MEGKRAVHQVLGFTTATSVWLSAALGVGAGGGLHFVATYSTILVIMVLRYGPRLHHNQQEDDIDNNNNGFDANSDVNEDADNDRNSKERKKEEHSYYTMSIEERALFYEWKKQKMKHYNEWKLTRKQQ